MSDILIVGGGIIGMLSARELVLAGMQVTVIDQVETGKESSWAGGGIISPLYPWRYAESVNALARWSQAHYSDLVDELKQETRQDAELLNSGLLITGIEAEKDEADRWGKKWSSQFEFISGKEVIEIDPQINPALAERDSLWLEDIQQVRNPRLVKVLKQYLLNKGVPFIENSRVTGFLENSGRITGVDTSAGIIESDKVLIASGAWSGEMIGLTGMTAEIEPVKGQMILLKTLPGFIRRIILSENRYIIPRKDGRVLVGSSIEHTGFEKMTTESMREELFAEALRIAPGLSEFDIEHHWAGLRPGSKDGIPYICQHPRIENLYINTGHYRNGVVLGPASAKLLAEIVLQEKTSVDEKPYQI